jgi:hypothetical protein
MARQPEDATAVLTRARRHLETYQAALGSGPSSARAVTAAWHVHRDLADLLLLAERLLAASAEAATP